MFRWVVRAVVVGAVFGLVVAVLMGIHTVLKTSDIFTVEVVEVRGALRTDKDVLKKIYQPFVGQNIFQEIPSGGLLMDEPWVVRLEMKRVMPDKLIVVVKEEEELISYQQGGLCTALTVMGNKIPVDCANVKVRVVEFPFPEEFMEFAKLYHKNELLQNSRIVIKNGFFTATGGDGTFMGSYAPGVFEDNMNVFVTQIKNRYKTIDRVDLTVRGKVYVKGVTNG